jgi:hypothetical protein
MCIRDQSAVESQPQHGKAMSPLDTSQHNDTRRNHSPPVTCLPARPNLRINTIQKFQEAVQGCANSLGKAFETLRGAPISEREVDPVAIQDTVRHITAAILSLNPIQQVIEADADQVPVITHLLTTTIERLRRLADETRQLEREGDNGARATKLNKLLTQFPSITDTLESTMMPPLATAKQELTDIRNP